MLLTACRCFIVQTFTSMLGCHKADLLSPRLSVANTSIALWSTHSTLFIMRCDREQMELLFITIFTTVLRILFTYWEVFSLYPHIPWIQDLDPDRWICMYILNTLCLVPRIELRYHSDPAVIHSSESVAWIKDMSDGIIKTNNHFPSTDS